MHLIVTTPLGTIKTVEKETTDANVESCLEFLEKINDFNYLKLDTDLGAIFLPKGIIQQSLFALVE